jgi:(p)ppGpp synthase/HD superfamily hydrolase
MEKPEEEKLRSPPKILKAARQAAQWHASQRRKGAAAEPYVNHLIEVAALVSAAGASEQVICAALRHDAIEDQHTYPQRRSPACLARPSPRWS